MDFINIIEKIHIPGTVDSKIKLTQKTRERFRLQGVLSSTEISEKVNVNTPSKKLQTREPH